MGEPVVLPTTGSVHQTAIERHASAILNGPLITGLVFLASAIPGSSSAVRHKNIVLLQKGVTVRLADATDIIQRVNTHTLHRDLVACGSPKYVITTVAERFYHGRCSSTVPGSGILVWRLDKMIVIAL
eukprot:TRINITY_DN17420_c0_g1_i2.p1 TRINITY_DN17420_c0_g1~~TRINITY_DN17420_c0_g1_i2.p1  ORF type:complete len:128 (+),score=18.26 TRINITY_DN17420_c0_g1_i2:47-430(+)